MSFFDPPHKKIMGWSPAYFQNAYVVWGLAVEDALLAPDIPKSAHRLFRTVLVGQLALRAAEDDPGSWSQTGLQRIELYTMNAIKLIPDAHSPQLLRASTQMFEALGPRTEIALNALNVKG